mmetsp:Transcript_39853/g.96171  ORF Transcript_39853/g.96171 Transcript_39853/m.96171 type:complete len:336 (+) Transcript_39853:134-1141(+)
MTSTQFSSEGFDLDALATTTTEGDGGGNGGGGGDIVYEIGGGYTKEQTRKERERQGQEEPTPSDLAEEWKQKGNDEFKQTNYLDAYDMYTEAIGQSPCPVKATEILTMRDEFESNERDKLIEQRRLEEEEKRRRRTSTKKTTSNNGNDNDNGHDHDHDNGNGNGNDNASEDEHKDGDPSKVQQQQQGPKPFVLPPQPYGDKLAVYYSNRAAALMHLDRYDSCIKDCDVSILLNPMYTKAYVRRSAAYEKTERTEDALRDMKHALQLDPSNVTVRKAVSRLQKIEDERLEKLKEETLGKLKDLGNSLLGNFGLSLDNFNAVQDPNTGSYSISFNQK